jgi:N-acetyl-anhydromuramoyl-L-alanine amidase
MAEKRPRLRFRVDPATGLLAAARQLPSPNQDARPPGMAPELIVIHCISLPPGEFGGPWIDKLFTNRLDPGAHPYFAEVAPLRVSAHLLDPARRRAGAVRALSPPRLARRGFQLARPRALQRLLGGHRAGGHRRRRVHHGAVPPPRRGIRALGRAYPGLSPRSLATHSEIAPGRKTDPGPGFDRARLARWLASRGYNPGCKERA